MSALEWYPRNSAKALDGMRRLTLEQRGAYNTLLDLIYSRGGPVPDEDRWLAGHMNVSVRKWLILRGELLSAGRIIARDERNGPVLSDELAEIEIEKQTSRRRVNAESGKIGGEKSSKRTPVLNENNDIGQANAQATAQASLKLETVELEVEKKETEANASVARTKAKGSRRCPPEWQPSAKLIDDATERGFSPAEIDDETANIRDHEFQRPYTDWDAVAAKWFRRATPRGNRNVQPAGYGQTPAAIAQRANTDARRNGWAEALARKERTGAESPDDRDGGPGFRGDMPRLRLVNATGDRA